MTIAPTIEASAKIPKHHTLILIDPLRHHNPWPTRVS